jgi:hypothetical protein
MTKARKQLEDHFAITVMDPGSWLEQAQGMRVAANPVLERLLGILHESQTRPGMRLQQLACIRGYMLLTGFAFENVLKAIAVKRGLLRTANQKLIFDTKLKREKGGHSLTALSRDLQLKLTLAERQYLRRLEEYIRWAGRYPVPLNSGEYADSYSGSRLSFTMADPRMGNALFDKLSVLVRSG